MRFQWKDGFHAPQKVSAEAVSEALSALPEPSPEYLLEASKRKRHVLHSDLWSEGDQIWAQRARLDRCRRIIGAVERVDIIGGKEITTRAVEFVKVSNVGAWARVESIIDDPEMLDAFMAEIQRMNDQAANKMTRLRALLRDRAAA